MFKLGRKARIYNPAVPHMSALLAGRTNLLSFPDIVENAVTLPDDLGIMLNDQLGDCTCAAYYHARQVWSEVAQGKEITNADGDVLKLYELSCGYNPDDASTDQGGAEQEVLTYLLKNGAPGCQPIIAFFEVDPRNFDDMKRAVYETGCVYIGVDLPESIVDSLPEVWDAPSDAPIAGGHAIILTGYNTSLDQFSLVSWGKKYTCSNNFLANFCEEAYAICDREWIQATGNTPLGMTIDELESQMRALKNG